MIEQYRVLGKELFCIIGPIF